LQNGEFTLELQPVVDLASGRVQCLEALLRWDHPEQGRIAPDQFIPIAEESGLIVELGEFAIRQAVQLVRELRTDVWPQARVAVNVSRRQLAAPGLVDLIRAELGRCGMPGQALIIEVTESMVMGNLDQAAQVLSSLREVGVSAAIDDFGTGYSSLNAMRRLPVEFLKIDKSFVADLEQSRESESIVSAIVAMAHGLGLQTVAEGVERQGQLELLRRIGCDLGQGYRIAQPMPLVALRPMLGLDGRIRGDPGAF
jgi:EAL domain-containing protein (putative c-di-GMP-specific phosphodiesterase class I)